MAIFGPKPWVNHFGKMSIFRLFELLVFIAQKGVFSFKNIAKDIFLAYINFKKKVGEMAIFGAKPSVISFAKMAIFLLFELLVFIAQKEFFSFQNIIKDIFVAKIAPQKSSKNGHFWTNTQVLNPLEKYQFYNFLKFLFLQPRKAFFVLEYRKRHFPSLYCLKNKVGKMAIFD